MAIPQLQDLPRSPVNLSSEYFGKYLELISKPSPLTTGGNATWMSPSSNITYPAPTGGEAQLLALLENTLDPYLLNAVKWNAISAEVIALVNGMTGDIKNSNAGLTFEEPSVTKLNKVLGKLVSVDETVDGVLYRKTTLNKVDGKLVSQNIKIYDTNGTTVISEILDTLVKIDGKLDEVVRTVII